MTAAWETD